MSLFSLYLDSFTCGKANLLFLFYIFLLPLIFSLQATLSIYSGQISIDKLLRVYYLLWSIHPCIIFFLLLYICTIVFRVIPLQCSNHKQSQENFHITNHFLHNVLKKLDFFLHHSIITLSIAKKKRIKIPMRNDCNLLYSIILTLMEKYLRHSKFPTLISWINWSYLFHKFFDISCSGICGNE
jgi:hypothetical protein